MRGRKANIPEKVYEMDFSGLVKKEKSPEMRIRLLGLLNVKKKKSFLQVAEALNVNEKSVRNWVKRFKENGIEGLRNKAGSGRKPILSSDKKEDFRESVIALQKNVPGGRIGAKDINNLLASKFHAKYAFSTTYKVLERCGLSWVSARSKHPKSDINRQTSFKKTLKLKLKKSCQNL